MVHAESNPATFLTALAVDPSVFLHALDLVNRRALLVGLSEPEYRQAAFLDDRVLTPQTQGGWFPLETVLERGAQVSATRPPHFIFHMGHCGSTLVSRLLGELPGCFAIREPMPLLALAYARRELDAPLARLNPEQWQRLFDTVSKLLGRTYRQMDRPVVKTTSTCANLIDPVLERDPESRAVLLYVDLETYLATMLRSEPTRESARANAPAWLGDLHVLTARTTPRLHELADTQQAAVAWLGAMAFFTRAAAKYSDRVRLVNFDKFLRNPMLSIGKAVNFLGFPTDRQSIRTLAQGRLMNTYAKIPEQSFNAQSRTVELQAARRQFKTEIGAGVQWANELTESSPAFARIKPDLSIVSS